MQVSVEVQMRDEFGRFWAVASGDSARAARELVEIGAELAAQAAPVGPPRRDYGRRPKLAPNVRPVMTSPKQGRIVADTGHALPQEVGAAPHHIPGAFGREEGVDHPGNAPQPYIRPVLARLRPLVPGILRRAFANLG